jgi:HAMP domain-containing protein
VPARHADSPRPRRSPAADAPAPPAAAAVRRPTPRPAAARPAGGAGDPPARRRRAGAGGGDGNGNGDGGGNGRGAANGEPGVRGVRTVAGPGGRNRLARGDDPLGRLTAAMRALRDGDFTRRLGASDDPAFDELFALFDELADRPHQLATEVARVGRTVGREGQMGDRVTIPGAAGGWATTGEALNALIGDVLQPTTEVARVLTAVAEGDLTQKMALDLGGPAVQGEFLRIGTTVNRMVDQLNAFSGEVTRVAREVGTEGQLGGQAHVPGVAGTWKDLTDSVNAMAGSLTTQVRNIADVTKAVAAGDLSRKITVDVKGEMLELKNTINTMVDQLSGFASEVHARGARGGHRRACSAARRTSPASPARGRT